LKKLLNIAGAVVFVIATALLLVQAWRYRETLAAALSDPAVLAGVIGGSLAYAALLGVLALSWSIVARQLADGAAPAPAGGAPGVRRHRDVHVYALCNIYKYLPGNIFHLVSRQALFANAGLGQGVIARATLVEACLHVAAVTTVAALLLAIGGDTGGIELVGIRLSLPLIVVAMAVPAVVGVSLAWTQLRGGGRLRPVALQLLFFAGYAAIVYVLFGLLAALPADRLLRLTGGYLVAWLAGFLTPGAPGGVGVREVVFMAFAHDDPAFAVEAAVAGRLVTTVGDLLLPVLTAGYGRFVPGGGLFRG